MFQLWQIIGMDFGLQQTPKTPRQRSSKRLLHTQDLFRPCGLFAEFLGRHFNYFAIAPDVERPAVSHMLFDYLLNSCFESHFSPLCQGQFENVRWRLSQGSHIAQPKCRMRLVSLYGVCLALPMQ